MNVSPAATRKVFDRRFYTSAAIAAALIVFVGFARSYYLTSIFKGRPLSALAHVHGFLMSLWFTLFVVQTRLVAAHRTDLHRKVGVYGAVLAGIIVVVGIPTAILAAKRGFTPGPPPLMFLTVPLVDICVFGLLTGTGIALRRRSDVHKRLMLVGSLSILGAAIGRLPIDAIKNAGPLAFFGITDLIILTCLAIDTVKHRKLHPVFAVAALIVIVSQPLRFILASTPLWMKFATWVTR
jgi:hypothetical protein